MGCPDYYFEESLRNFAYIRNMMTDKAKADYLYNDAAIEEVKDELKKQKDALKKEEEPEYYFDAGVAYQLTMDEAEKDGIDAVNAALEESTSLQSLSLEKTFLETETRKQQIKKKNQFPGDRKSVV